MKNNNIPYLDISIVTYNSSQWLENYFESLLTQDYPLECINIFIHDNGSNDDTLQKIDSNKQTWLNRFASYCVNTSNNIGFGAGHNANLQLSSAPYFLVSNVDLTLECDAIMNAVRMAQLDADDVACWEFRQKPYEHPKYYNPVTLETTWSSSACALFRRDAMVSIGGYEPHLFMYGEDVEISYRLRDRGYKLRYCSNAICWHYCYSKPFELKRNQFFGNIMANALLRLRYGNISQMLSLIGMLATLWILPYPVKNRWKELLIVNLKIIKKAPFFLLTRKKSSLKFPFNKWDYELPREGAFYELRKSSIARPL